MDVFTELPKGLGVLEREKGREVYCDLPDALGISETEPLVPIPLAELTAWAQRFADDAFLGSQLAYGPSSRSAPAAVLLRHALDEGFLGTSRLGG